jgi:DNA-binding transcriptional LysR family regulator
MNNDQLNGLIALKAVAEKKNFTAAAESLRISASAVSQSIKQLENKLGVALLSRTTRSVSVTEVGEQFLNQANPAIEQILAAIENVGSYANKPSGLLRLNLPRLIYLSYLAPLIKSFNKKYPEITVELFFEDGQLEIFAKGFDAGIRLSDILAKDVIAIKLFGPVKFVTAASPKYLDKMGRPKHPKDLLMHNCIRPRFGNDNLYDRWEFEQKLKSGKKDFQVQVKGSLIFNDSFVALNAAIDVAGIIYTTQDAIKDQVKSGKLEIILSQFAPTSAGFYLYYPSKAQVLPKLRVFIEHVKNFTRHC